MLLVCVNLCFSQWLVDPLSVILLSDLFTASVATVAQTVNINQINSEDCCRWVLALVEWHLVITIIRWSLGLRSSVVIQSLLLDIGWLLSRCCQFQQYGMGDTVLPYWGNRLCRKKHSIVNKRVSFTTSSLFRCSFLKSAWLVSKISTQPHCINKQTFHQLKRAFSNSLYPV